MSKVVASPDVLRARIGFGYSMQGEEAQMSDQLLKPTPNFLKSWFRKAAASTTRSLGSADHIPSIPQPRTWTSHPGPPAGDGSRCASRTVTLQAMLRQVCDPEPPPPMQFSKAPVAWPFSSYIIFRSA